MHCYKLLIIFQGNQEPLTYNVELTRGGKNSNGAQFDATISGTFKGAVTLACESRDGGNQPETLVLKHDTLPLYFPQKDNPLKLPNINITNAKQFKFACTCEGKAKVETDDISLALAI